APRVRPSADTERHGHISKEGNRMVRTLLLQATLSAMRHTGGPVRRQYRGVLKRRGKQLARIAATATLLGVLDQMMKQGLTYDGWAVAHHGSYEPASTVTVRRRSPIGYNTDRRILVIRGDRHAVRSPS